MAVTGVGNGSIEMVPLGQGGPKTDIAQGPVLGGGPSTATPRPAPQSSTERVCSALQRIGEEIAMDLIIGCAIMAKVLTGAVGLVFCCAVLFPFVLLKISEVAVVELVNKIQPNTLSEKLPTVPKFIKAFLHGDALLRWMSKYFAEPAALTQVPLGISAEGLARDSTKPKPEPIPRL